MSVIAETENEATDQWRSHARSVVATRFGIVASSQVLASSAGAKVLEGGGNAVDAAIAANALLGLVEPTGNGMGGDLFAIVYEAKTGKLHGLNSSGWAPSGLTIEFLRAKGEMKVPVRGIHSATVPGAVAGWDALHKRFGKLQWAALFAPAIYYAEHGFPVTEWIAMNWSAGSSFFWQYPDAAKTFLRDGSAPAAGAIWKNPDLAKSLRTVALGGTKAFYNGPITAAILGASEKLGGTFTSSDLSEFKPEWVEPISTEYRGWTVSELPPNGQGIAALSMLNLMEQFPLSSYGQNSADALHIMIEAKKLAYADMFKYVGDPRFGAVPVQEIISKDRAAERAKLIDVQKANCSVMPSDFISMTKLPGADTIYLSTVDREGNMVSLIQSNYLGFGSGVVPPGTGFMLQNRGALFTMEPGQPNSLAPRKRPLHTIIPGFMSKGDVRIGFGIMGGWNQAQAHAQFVANVVDFGMNVQAALESARFTKNTFDGCAVSMESRIPEAVQAELVKRGHDINKVGAFSNYMGGGQAVMRNADGVNFAGSDPRKDGAAVPETPRFPIPSLRRSRR